MLMLKERITVAEKDRGHDAYGTYSSFLEEGLSCSFSGHKHNLVLRQRKPVVLLRTKRKKSQNRHILEKINTYHSADPTV